MQENLEHNRSKLIITIIKRPPRATQHKHSHRKQACRHSFLSLSATLQIIDLDSEIASGFPCASRLRLHTGWATVSAIQ